MSDPLEPSIFEVLASPRATGVLMSALLMAVGIGMFVPQAVTAETIGLSYSTSVAQVIVAMDLHNIGGSWLLQLVLVLLGLNLAARLAVSALGRAQRSGTRVAKAIGRGG
ncbi:MAG: multisubunit Na+/H+ antiporter MnhG subunit, partial [Myxococcota bacterium]